MKKETIRGHYTPYKPRAGVLPTRVERDRTHYTRKTKHKCSD
jgi:hypothetical protein